MPQSEMAPADEDLQNLYDQVIAGFVEPPPPAFPSPASQNSSFPSSSRQEVHSVGLPHYTPSAAADPPLSRTRSHTPTSPTFQGTSAVIVTNRAQTDLEQPLSLNAPTRSAPKEVVPVVFRKFQAAVPQPSQHQWQHQCPERHQCQNLSHTRSSLGTRAYGSHSLHYSLILPRISGRRLPNPPRSPTFASNGRQYASYIDHVDIDRNSSTTSTNSTDTGTSFGRPPSSLATTVDRNSSYGFPKPVIAATPPTFGFPSPPTFGFPTPEHHTYDGNFSGTEEEELKPLDPSMLSNIAIRLRDKIPRSTHMKGSIPYPRAFSGEDIVVSFYSSHHNPASFSTLHAKSTIQSLIQPYILAHHSSELHDRRAALQIAHSLQNQLFFYEVEWSDQLVVDRPGDVYLFLDENEVTPDGQAGITDVPTSVVTYLSKCYSPSCAEGAVCYAHSCPRRVRIHFLWYGYALLILM